MTGIERGKRMLEELWRIAGSLDPAWFVELALFSLSWVFLRHKGPIRQIFRLRMLAEYILLMLAVIAVTLLSMAWAGQSAVFFLIRIAAQGAVTAIYMMRFSEYRKKTQLLLWLGLTTASMSIFHISGQCSQLLGGVSAHNSFVQGSVRVAFHGLIILAALWLRHFQFDDYLSIPTGGLWMIGADTASVLLLYVVETFSFYESIHWVVLTLLVAYLGLLIMTLAAVQALFTMCREQQAIIDLQAEKQRYLSEQGQTRMTEAMLHDIRSIRHDLKNQYAYMQILLSEKRYAELETYFSELLDALPAPLNLVDCGNHTVNTVLNMEFAKLRADQISLRHKLVVPPVLPFKDEDICSILSNLIDNAAEECRRMRAKGGKNPEITLEIHPHQSYLFIQCANHSDRTALTRRKGGLQTTKGDAELHGYGTQIIMKLAEKYNGFADYSLTGGRFVAQVMLDMEAEVIK